MPSCFWQPESGLRFHQFRRMPEFEHADEYAPVHSLAECFLEEG
jgi:hypothetical protein